MPAEPRQNSYVFIPQVAALYDLLDVVDDGMRALRLDAPPDKGVGPVCAALALLRVSSNSFSRKNRLEHRAIHAAPPINYRITPA